MNRVICRATVARSQITRTGTISDLTGNRCEAETQTHEMIEKPDETTSLPASVRVDAERRVFRVFPGWFFERPEIPYHVGEEMSRSVSDGSYQQDRC